MYVCNVIVDHVSTGRDVAGSLNISKARGGRVATLRIENVLYGPNRRTKWVSQDHHVSQAVDLANRKMPLARVLIAQESGNVGPAFPQVVKEKRHPHPLRVVLAEDSSIGNLFWREHRPRLPSQLVPRVPNLLRRRASHHQHEHYARDRVRLRSKMNYPAPHDATAASRKMFAALCGQDDEIAIASRICGLESGQDVLPALRFHHTPTFRRVEPAAPPNR